jgi:hypothetical protein
LRCPLFWGTSKVSQALFDRTQLADKGIGDGKDYTFLCPTAATFEKFGVKNIIGEQDIDFGKELGIVNVLD